MDGPVGHRRDRPAVGRPGPRHVRPAPRSAVRRRRSSSATGPRRWPATTASPRGSRAELERLGRGRRVGPRLQPAPGVGRPALRRPHPRPVRPPAPAATPATRAAPTTARSPSAAPARSARGCRCGASRRRSAGAPRTSTASRCRRSSCSRSPTAACSRATPTRSTTRWPPTDKTLELVPGEHYFEDRRPRRGRRPRRRLDRGADVGSSAWPRPCGRRCRRRCPPTTSTRTAPAPGGRAPRVGRRRPRRSRASSPTTCPGVYLRNTENPVHESIGRYHPFDGDGMLHQIAFHDGRASYRNRFVRTDGFLAEQDAAESLWTGMLGAARAVQAGGRLGRPRPHEGRVEHRRRRPQRPGPHELLAVRRPLRARPAHARAARARPRGRRASRRRRASPPTPSSTSAPASCSCSATARSAPYLHLRRRRAPTASSCARSTSSCPGPRLPARHGLHRALRRSSTTCRCSGTLSCWPRACTSRASSPTCPSRFAIVRARRHRRRPLVRGRPHLRPALDQRLRGRRRGRARRLLPARPVAAASAKAADAAPGVRLPLPRPRAAPGPPAPLAVQPRRPARRPRSRSPTASWSSA